MIQDADMIIRVGMARNRIATNSELSKRIGLVRQTLSHKRKYPSTFTGGEIASLTKILKWTDEELGNFIRRIK